MKSTLTRTQITLMSVLKTVFWDKVFVANLNLAITAKLNVKLYTVSLAKISINLVLASATVYKCRSSYLLSQFLNILRLTLKYRKIRNFFKWLFISISKINSWTLHLFNFLFFPFDGFPSDDLNEIMEWSKQLNELLYHPCQWWLTNYNL